MRLLTSLVIAVAFSTAAIAQNCGPQYANQMCALGNCCGHHGWCDTSPDHCNPTTCLEAFSGPDSSCALGTSVSASPYESSIPNIDVCGAAPGGISCPGAGVPPSPNEVGYYYRCCSAAGHCGPKNNIQDQSLYCGAGCQPGYGDCSTDRIPPPLPTAPPMVAGNGETCGPIVDSKCGDGLCCSGSNYCGTGVDYCGAANWCQPLWGTCS